MSTASSHATAATLQMTSPGGLDSMGSHAGFPCAWHVRARPSWSSSARWWQRVSRLWAAWPT